MVLVSYEYYSGTYGGTEIPEAVFHQFAYRAGVLLQHMIRAGKTVNHDEKILWLLCEICDRLYQDDCRNSILHESADGYSVTYDEHEVDSEVLKIVRQHLGNDGVLFRGRAI